jgi:hypothetical protein
VFRFGLALCQELFPESIGNGGGSGWLCGVRRRRAQSFACTHTRTHTHTHIHTHAHTHSHTHTQTHTEKGFLSEGLTRQVAKRHSFCYQRGKGMGTDERGQNIAIVLPLLAMSWCIYLQGFRQQVGYMINLLSPGLTMVPWPNHIWLFLTSVLSAQAKTFTYT